MMADRQYNFPTIDSTHSIIQLGASKTGLENLWHMVQKLMKLNKGGQYSYAW